MSINPYVVPWECPQCGKEHIGTVTDLPHCDECDYMSRWDVIVPADTLKKMKTIIAVDQAPVADWIVTVSFETRITLQGRNRSEVESAVQEILDDIEFEKMIVNENRFEIIEAEVVSTDPVCPVCNRLCCICDEEESYDGKHS